MRLDIFSPACLGEKRELSLNAVHQWDRFRQCDSRFCDAAPLKWNMTVWSEVETVDFFLIDRLSAHAWRVERVHDENNVDNDNWLKILYGTETISAYGAIGLCSDMAVNWARRRLKSKHNILLQTTDDKFYATIRDYYIFFIYLCSKCDGKLWWKWKKNGRVLHVDNHENNHQNKIKIVSLICCFIRNLSTLNPSIPIFNAILLRVANSMSIRCSIVDC